jgi:V/A-type H+-transporting ATPase subunit D
MSLTINFRTSKTRKDLIKIKNQLELASKAQKLIEDKYKLLMREQKNIQESLQPLKKNLDSKVENAYSQLAEAIITLGLRRVYNAILATTANDDLEYKQIIIRGIPTLRFISNVKKRALFERGYGLTNTNLILDAAAEAFEELIKQIIQVIEVENTVKILKREIDKTRIRASALEKILIPSLKNERKKIENKLEENEKEGQIRVKWIKENK